MNKPTTLELTDLDSRAIRSFILWIHTMERDEDLELYDYQRNTLAKLEAVTQYHELGTSKAGDYQIGASHGA